MEQITDLPNIGPVLAKNLQAVGVETPEALRTIGAEEAWLCIRLKVDSGACLHQLQAFGRRGGGNLQKGAVPGAKGGAEGFF